MARLLADEDFKAAVRERLVELGHDVQSALQAGIANVRTADNELLARATADRRAVLTHNRIDYVRLHRVTPGHGGIIVCKQYPDAGELADQIHAALEPIPSTEDLLIRVYLTQPPRVERRTALGKPEDD